MKPKNQNTGTPAKRTLAFPTVACLLLSMAAVGAVAPTAVACSADSAASTGKGASNSCADAPETIQAIILNLVLANSNKACTTTSGSCTFECNDGDNLYVAASGGAFLRADALCGGAGASCDSLLGGLCTGKSDDAAHANDSGICQGSQLAGKPTISCAAGH